MNHIRLPLICAALLLLGGCYFKAYEDLVGEHALKLARADSLMVIDDEIYRIDEGDSGYVNVCQIARKDDRPGQCESDFKMKIERTGRGNYLAQLGDEYFALITRAPGSDSACFYLLGAALALDEVDWTPFNRLEARTLKGLPKDVNSRQDLARIVDLYESRILPEDPACPGNHLAIRDPAALKLEGDAAD